MFELLEATNIYTMEASSFLQRNEP